MWNCGALVNVDSVKNLQKITCTIPIKLVMEVVSRKTKPKTPWALRILAHGFEPQPPAFCSKFSQKHHHHELRPRTLVRMYRKNIHVSKVWYSDAVHPKSNFFCQKTMWEKKFSAKKVPYSLAGVRVDRLKATDCIGSEIWVCQKFFREVWKILRNKTTYINFLTIYARRKHFRQKQKVRKRWILDHEQHL